MDQEPMQHTDPNSAVMRLAVVGAGRPLNSYSGAPVAAIRLAVTGLARPRREGGRAPTRPCETDREIATAAASIAPGVIVGHCSGATGLEPLTPHETFLRIR